MENLAWTHQVVVAPYKTRVGIRVNSADLLDQVRTRLLPGWQEESGGHVDHLWSIFQDEQRSLLYYEEELVSPQPGVLDTFDRYFHLYLGHTARDRTFIHAGVVGFEGKALLLPGSSHVGKSTLTKALLDHGATFYSDDLAVIDEQCRVSPYPKPMSLRDGRGQISALDLGWHAQLPSLPVTVIAHLTFRPDGGEDWTQMSAAQASLALIENSLSLRREPARDMRCITRLCAQATSYRGQRGEAAEAARILLNLLSASGA